MRKAVRERAYKAFGLVFLAGTLLILYAPLLVILILSVNDSRRGYAWEGFTLEWYSALFTGSALTEPILNTLAVAGAATLVSTFLGTLFAIGINALEKKKRVKMVLLNNIPVVNPDIVTAISLMIVFSLLSLTFGFGTVLLAHIFFSMPYVVLSILPALRKLDPNLYEAGLDLGCTRRQGITKVILPNISTGIFSGAMMAFTMSIDDFVITYFTSGANYMNVSTWLYSKLRLPQSFTPAAYAYNILVFAVTIAVIVSSNLVNLGKERISHEKSR